LKQIIEYPKQFVAKADFNQWKIGSNGFILITLVSFFVGGVYGYVMAGILTGLILGGFMAYMIPALWLEQVEKKNMKHRRETLVDAMRAIQNAYLATNSFVAAIQASLPLMQEPAASAFRQVLIHERTGIPLSEAMQHVKAEFPFREVDTFIRCVDVMQEAGGQHAMMVMERFIRLLEDTQSREETFEAEMAVRNTEARQLFILFLAEIALFKLFETLNPDLVQDGFGMDPFVALLLGINVVAWLTYKKLYLKAKNKMV
jgi:Flp pilus assembly protein TadB